MAAHIFNAGPRFMSIVLMRWCSLMRNNAPPSISWWRNFTAMRSHPGIPETVLCYVIHRPVFRRVTPILQWLRRFLLTLPGCGHFGNVCQNKRKVNAVELHPVSSTENTGVVRFVRLVLDVHDGLFKVDTGPAGMVVPKEFPGVPKNLRKPDQVLTRPGNIRYAANKTCVRDVASRFDMSESTVYRVLQRVAEFLMTLGPSEIKFPADLENLTSSFEKIVRSMETGNELSELELLGSEAEMQLVIEVPESSSATVATSTANLEQTAATGPAETAAPAVESLPQCSESSPAEAGATAAQPAASKKKKDTSWPRFCNHGNG
ncbi:hypothetical protein MRX96_047753 [Rhipicephalus microplus]